MQSTMRPTIVTTPFCILLFTLLLYCVNCDDVIQHTYTATNNKPCIPRDFGFTSIVCVCNATYCDEVEPILEVESGKYVQVVSSLAGQRFEVSQEELALESFQDQHYSSNDVEIVISDTVKHQNIFGFGGAFTDSTAINLASVSPSLRQLILRSYFTSSGLNYTFGRVPIAGTDFSTHKYSYDDVEGDTTLSYFNLTVEDLEYKIPIITQALRLQPSLKLIAAAWSAPKWMKTNNEFDGYGFLKPQYNQLWADYLIRFLHEYQKYNLTIWGISTQNEPFDGQIPHFPFNCMGWTAEEQRDWIKNHLGPTLYREGFGSVRVIILDDQVSFVNSWCRTILQDPEAAKYVSGIGIHWYLDSYYPSSSILDIAHGNFPMYFILSTEASIGSNPGEHQVILGSWERGEEYAHSIINDLNHWVTGWIDWNLVLDLNGGPSWAENFLDAPIIVDSVTDLAYKQPMYYVMGHFSKYIPENSVRVHHELIQLTDTGIVSTVSTIFGFEVLTAQRPDGYFVIVVLNKLSHAISLKIRRHERNSASINLECSPRSIRTIISKL